MKMQELTPGQTINLDNGFACHSGGPAIVRKDGNGNLYFDCNDGHHYLDGQENENGDLVGVSQ